MAVHRASAQVRSTNDQGFSLIELIVVVGILALITGLAVGTGSGRTEDKAYAAAAEIATALRWARQESQRVDASRGVTIDEDAGRIQVYRAAERPPAVLVPVYDVRHPLTKQLWDRTLSSRRETSGVELSSEFNFLAGCTTSRIGLVFSDGEVGGCADPATVRLDTAIYTVTHDGFRREVRVDGLTGRITLQ